MGEQIKKLLQDVEESINQVQKYEYLTLVQRTSMTAMLVGIQSCAEHVRLNLPLDIGSILKMSNHKMMNTKR